MLSIGQTLFLDLKDDKIDKNDHFKCKVVEINNRQISIDYPIHEQTGKVGFFLDGQQFRASFISEDENFYAFETEVQGRKKENIPMLLLSYPGDDKLIRIQRRQFVRVEATVDTAIHPLHNEFNPFVAITADISGGGAMMIMPPRHSLNPGQIISCWFSLPMLSGEHFYLNLKAKVIRIIKTDQGRDRIPLQFLDVKESEREHLIRFCYDRQLSLRRKEQLS